MMMMMMKMPLECVMMGLHDLMVMIDEEER